MVKLVVIFVMLALFLVAAFIIQSVFLMLRPHDVSLDTAVTVIQQIGGSIIFLLLAIVAMLIDRFYLKKK